MSDPTPERPLVTFALFAYNQEQYIREAVEGAFAQTYEPLEIILSDDCSKDRTFEIMQEMAAEYKGPHRVVVRQSVVNAGLLNHVLLVSRISTGEIIVVAAGDDIALPKRIEISCHAFSDPDVYAMSGDDIIIDQNGKETDWDDSRIDRRNAWHARSQTWIHGATAAYRAKFLNRLPLAMHPVFYEDMTFSDLLIATQKKSVRLAEPLIQYRYHSDNLSDRLVNDVARLRTDVKTTERWKRVNQSKKYCLDALYFLSESGETVSTEELKRLNREERYFFFAANWMSNSFIEKFEYLYYAWRHGSIKSAIVRVFGSQTFHVLKNVEWR